MTTIFVTRLPQGTTPEELKKLFGKYGPSNVHLPSRGSGTYGFVDVKDEIAETAIAEMDGAKYRGRKLAVEFSTSKQSQTKQETHVPAPIDTPTPDPTPRKEIQMTANRTKVSGVLEALRDAFEKIRLIHEDAYAAPRYIIGIAEEMKFAALMMRLDEEIRNVLLLDFLPQLEYNQAADFVMKSIGLKEEDAMGILKYLAKVSEDRRIPTAISLQLIREEYLADRVTGFAGELADAISASNNSWFGRVAAKVVK